MGLTTRKYLVAAKLPILRIPECCGVIVLITSSAILEILRTWGTYPKTESGIWVKAPILNGQCGSLALGRLVKTNNDVLVWQRAHWHWSKWALELNFGKKPADDPCSKRGRA
jgi:hypothetical protein